MSHDHSMSCREMAEHISDYLDGDQAASLHALIDAHRGECPPCEAFIKTLARTVELVRSQPCEPLPADVKNALLEALRRAAPSKAPDP